jgi:hypothetical protein
MPGRSSYLATEESQRRLLYVALARGTKFLTITRHRGMKPSPYLAELSGDYIVQESDGNCRLHELHVELVG